MLVVNRWQLILSLLTTAAVDCAHQNTCAANYLSNQTVSRDDNTEDEASCAKLDPQNWQFRYFDEVSQLFKPLVNEETIDMRVANQIHTINIAKLINNNLYSVDTGETERDHLLERQIAGPKVDDKLCGLHLQLMIEQLEHIGKLVESRRENSGNSSSLRLQDQHLRLARSLDSFGKPGSGLQSGRTSFLGDYKQCLSTNLLLNNQPVASRYCIAKLSLDKHLEASLRLHRRQLHESPAQLYSAACLPETCHTANLAPHLQIVKKLVDSQFILTPSTFVDTQLEMDSVFCIPDRDSPWAQIPVSAKLLLALLLAWICLVVYITLKLQKSAAKTQQATSNNLIASLCLKQSYLDLIDSGKQGSSRVQLDVLNPVKVLGSVFVVFAHAMLFQIITTDDILRTYKMLEESHLFYALAAGTNVVDSFFVLTGILVTYISLKKLDSHKVNQNGFKPKFQFFKCCLVIASSRYLRLVPMYFLAFWFKKSLFARLNSGPLWDSGLNRFTYVGGCEQLDSWWTPFTFMAGYQAFSKQCMSATWSIVCDLIFNIVAAPIIVLISTQRSRLATYLSVAICLTSACLAYWQYDNLPLSVKEDFKDIKVRSIRTMFREMTVYYTAPQVRAATFFIGVLAGQYLYRYDSGHLKNWPGWIRGSGTKLAVLVIIATPAIPALIPFFRPIFLDHYEILGKLFALEHAFGRPLWGLSNAILFLRMMTDWSNNLWMESARGRFWRSAAKLNLIILLTHMDIQAFDVFSQTTSGSFSFYKTLNSFASSYLLCVLLAVPLHIVFENPIDKLVKSLIRNETHKKLDRRSSGKTNGGASLTGRNSDKLEQKLKQI